MTANAALLNGWLRRRSGFDGVIVTDYNAIGELLHHGIAADLAEAATLALKAGVDIDMMSDAYRRGLPVALERGWVTVGEIDAAVRRVLTLKKRLGLFDDPYRRGAVPETAAALASRRRLARLVGSRAIVMLKNDAETLPLDNGLPRLAVVGPLADASTDMRGPWWGAAAPEGQVTVLAALRQLLSESRVAHARGVDIDGGDASGVHQDAAPSAPRRSTRRPGSARCRGGETGGPSRRQAAGRRAQRPTPGARAAGPPPASPRSPAGESASFARCMSTRSGPRRPAR